MSRYTVYSTQEEEYCPTEYTDDLEEAKEVAWTNVSNTHVHSGACYNVYDEEQGTVCYKIDVLGNTWELDAQGKLVQTL